MRVVRNSDCAEFQRRSLRIINLRPDQMASTAQTFTSTKPSGSARARMTSSVRSVSTLAVFFGHETVDKTDQQFAIECSEQHAAGSFRRDEMRQRDNVEIGNTPDLFLHLLDSAQFRKGLNLANGNVVRTQFLSRVVLRVRAAPVSTVRSLPLNPLSRSPPDSAGSTG